MHSNHYVYIWCSPVIDTNSPSPQNSTNSGHRCLKKSNNNNNNKNRIRSPASDVPCTCYLFYSLCSIQEATSSLGATSRAFMIVWFMSNWCSRDTIVEVSLQRFSFRHLLVPPACTINLENLSEMWEGRAREGEVRTQGVGVGVDVRVETWWRDSAQETVWLLFNSERALQLKPYPHIPMRCADRSESTKSLLHCTASHIWWSRSCEGHSWHLRQLRRFVFLVSRCHGVPRQQRSQPISFQHILIIPTTQCTMFHSSWSVADVVDTSDAEAFRTSNTA